MISMIFQRGGLARLLIMFTGQLITLRPWARKRCVELVEAQAYFFIRKLMPKQLFFWYKKIGALSSFSADPI